MARPTPDPHGPSPRTTSWTTFSSLSASSSWPCPCLCPCPWPFPCSGSATSPFSAEGVQWIVTGDARTGLTSSGACAGAVAAAARTVGVSTAITIASAAMRLDTVTLAFPLRPSASQHETVTEPSHNARGSPIGHPAKPPIAPTCHCAALPSNPFSQPPFALAVGRRCRIAGVPCEVARADHARSPATGHVHDAPAQEDDEAVLESDQIREVHREPHEPCREPGEAHPLDVGDRARTADRREIPLVAVVERARLAPIQAAGDQLCGVPALLDRDGCEAGQARRCAVRCAHVGHVSERDHLRMPGECEIGPDGQASRAIDRDTRLAGERPCKIGCLDTRSPDHGARGRLPKIARRLPNHHRPAADSGDLVTDERCHAEPLEVADRLARE